MDAVRRSIVFSNLEEPDLAKRQVKVNYITLSPDAVEIATYRRASSADGDNNRRRGIENKLLM